MFFRAGPVSGRGKGKRNDGQAHRRERMGGRVTAIIRSRSTSLSRLLDFKDPFCSGSRGGADYHDLK